MILRASITFFTKLIISMILLLPSTSGAHELKVLTLNVWGNEWGLSPLRAERILQIKKYLNEHKSNWDFILIQEAWSARDQLTLSESGYTYNSLHVPGSKRTGLLILSRYPIEEQMFVPFKTSVPLGREMAFFSKRGLLLAKINVPHLNVPLWVANTHLTANYTTTGLRSFEDVRELQSLEIADILKKYAASNLVIVGGDFNTKPEDVLWIKLKDKIFKNFLIPAQPQPGSQTYGPPNSFVTADKAEGHLDHLWGSEEHFNVDHGKVTLTEKFLIKQALVNVSDHFAWETTFQIKDGPWCESALIRQSTK